MRPDDVPMGRALTNVEAFVQVHPEDPNGHLTLARLHSLAFANQTDAVSMFSPPGDPSQTLPTISRHQFAQPRVPPRGEELAVHLRQSIRSFERALELDPDSALSHLGLAYVLERGVVLAEVVEADPGRADGGNRQDQDLEAILARWRERTIEEYFRAYELAIPRDGRIETQPMDGLPSLVSYEAGKAYVKLLSARGARDESEKQRLAEVRAGVERLEAKPHSNSVTPIIFSLSGASTLADHLASGRWVRFDLDGDDRPEPRPWVGPDTAILVWDPKHAGVITSGRQLFGSVTWWMFFADGYRAMDALDDDRDGRLSDGELVGLAVWLDRNTNGVSEPGEVDAMEELPIASLATRATSIEDGSPANLSGLTLTDGRVLPTYDWIVPPVTFEPCAPPIDSIPSR
jgi:hypothetical protein